MNRAYNTIALALVVTLGIAAGTSAQAADPAPAPAPAPAAAEKAPPLPVHTIEGVGGGAITPTAYLVNGGKKGEPYGLPSLSATGVWIGHGRNLETFGITETLFQHVELGYGLERFGLGDTEDDIESATGARIRGDVYLHNFNARVLALEENSFSTSFLPAVTLGLDWKVNDGIKSIDHDLGGALKGIGFDRSNGIDLTLTASKTFGNVFGRPLIASAGLRNSDAAWLGFLGFSDHRTFTFEGNLIYIAQDWLTIGYEFRGKHNPYKEIRGLVEGENDMHAISAIFIPNRHLSIALVYGIFGKVLNYQENHAVAVQLKYEF